MRYPRSASSHCPVCLETLEPRLLLDAGDIAVATGTYYDVYFTAPTAVGSGAENLVSTTLMVENISGNSAYDPTTIAGTGSADGLALSGTFHEEQFTRPVEPHDLLPSPDLESSGGSAIDTHWLLDPDDLLAVLDPMDEDVIGTDSDEPDTLGGTTGFAEELSGTFVIDDPNPPTSWAIAQIVVPLGSYVTFSLQFAGGGKADTFDQTVRIGVADLMILAVSVPSGAKYLPGDDVTLSGTIRNSGTADATSSTSELRLSKNKTWGDADDVLVTSWTGALARATSVDLPASSIPWDAAGGKYYVGIRTDTEGTAYELNTANNTWWSTNKLVTLISPGSVFDEDFYLSKYADIAQYIPSVFTNAFEHFMRFGQTEGRQPNAFYDEDYYLEHNTPVADAVDAGIFDSGFDHFIRYGQNESRDISPYFSQRFYLQHNQDVRAAVQAGIFSSAFDHFLNYGQTEARRFHWLFDRAYYRSTYADVVNAVNAGIFSSVFEHFVLHGRLEKRKPSDYFRPTYYLSMNPDVANAIQAGHFESAFDHYNMYGAREKRATTPEFSEGFYLNQYPDVKTAVQNGTFVNGLQHYILSGRAEGRLPLPPAAISTFMPMDEGNQWSWAGTFNSTALTRSAEVLAAGTLEGESYQRMQTEQQIGSSTVQETSYFSQTGSGWVVYGWEGTESGGEYLEVCSNPLMQAPASMVPGQTFSDTAALAGEYTSGGYVGAHWTTDIDLSATFVGYETIEVDAGVFYAMKVTYTQSSSETWSYGDDDGWKNQTETGTRWYAEGVGLVRHAATRSGSDSENGEWESPTEIEFELMSYSLT